MQLAIQLAAESVRSRHGHPFGAVLTRDDEVYATGVNTIVWSHDPTAHAEIVAIREASAKKGTHRLDDLVMYASGQPCPMCLAAMYFAGIPEVHYAHSNEEAEGFGLSTTPLYQEIAKPHREQSMRISHLPPHPDQEHLYSVWLEVTGGKR